jgi:uncharacterized membrane protein
MLGQSRGYRIAVLAAALLSAFVLTGGGMIPSLDAHGDLATIDVPRATVTSAQGISDSGVIVGSFIDEAGMSHGFIRTVRGAYTAVDYPDARDTGIWGINGAGDIAGVFHDTRGKTHGFIRTADGTFATIDVPGAGRTSAWGISDIGQIAGTFEDGRGKVHGFLGERKSGFMTIDPPHAVRTNVLGSNPVGDVVGWFDDANGKTHGFVRILPGKHVTLNVFDLPHGRDISPNGINNFSEIVGSFSQNNTLHGFLRSDDGTFTVLDVPGAINTSAWGINDDDAIVGRFSDGNKRTHGFLLLTHKRAHHRCVPSAANDEPGGGCRRARVVQPPGET